MATITTLEREKTQPSTNVTGQEITLNENWIMTTSSSVLPAEAATLILALAEGNAFGWLRISLDGHPANDTLRVTDFTVDRDEEEDQTFRVTSALSNDKDEINRSQRAVDAPSFYSFQNVDSILEVDIDPITGKSIAASNGEEYFPKLQRKGTLKRIIISRNETKYDSNRAANYENKLNKTSMRINGRSYLARSIMLESWTGDNAFDNDGSEYWKVKYSVLIDNENLHKIELIDAASGPDKNGIHPQSVSWGGAVPVKPYKLGRAAPRDGLYMSRTDQQNADLFYTNEFYLHTEIDMNFLRL